MRPDTIEFVRKQKQQAYVRRFFAALFQAWGNQHWWPAESPFEVVVGALLTQNTAWTNVELAMGKLRAAGVLNIDGIRRIPLPELEPLLRSAGYFRQKAGRLKKFVAYLDEKYEGSLQLLFARPTQDLRDELLALEGIGPETADSILLYAGNHEVFVVDAYTRRILSRHGVMAEAAKYEHIRQLFERALDSRFAVEISAQACKIEANSGKKPAGAHHPPSAMSSANRSPRAQLLNEMHGLIVGVGKNYCHSRRVDCQRCPLGIFLDRAVKLPRKPK